jgi:subtilisin family serine protease
MATEKLRPAYSQSFEPETLQSVTASGPIGAITRAWAWEGSTGKGVRVGIIDSGLEADHPALGGSVYGGVSVEYDEQAPNNVRFEAEEKPVDLFGHGTACGGIIHSLAPEAELYSIRVLGRDMKSRAVQFAGGIRWALENNIQVVNMSLSTNRDEYFALFHQLADDAYFKSMVLVAAVNNYPMASYPSLYASVFSVAAHEGTDPFTYYYNPSPPVEFGAPGINVRVAWLNGGYSISTGNSFAAPHIAGIVALIRARHPELTPFQIKTVLYACAANTQVA